MEASKSNFHFMPNFFLLFSVLYYSTRYISFQASCVLIELLVNVYRWWWKSERENENENTSIFFVVFYDIFLFLLFFLFTSNRHPRPRCELSVNKSWNQQDMDTIHTLKHSLSIQTECEFLEWAAQKNVKDERISMRMRAMSTLWV